MSILDIKKSVSDDGIKKTIDEKSHDVALDILQRGIYAYPVKSTVRELASNAYDANVERDTAKQILLGKEAVEDHYDMEKIDGAFHASGWDPDYYDLKYLSDDKNVYLYYEEGVQRDTLRIKDNGIGLGKDRLVGYFQLAYSSKRAQKGALGKWGLGNKSALSLGIDSYTVINRYNGKKFRFEVYLNNVVSVTPKFSNGKKNNFITVSVPQPGTEEITNPDTGEVTTRNITINKDFIFFYEDTEETNGLELVIPVKKHEKKEFFRAIEEQLMYIPNVIFQHKKQEEFGFTTVDIAAKVLYRDTHIVISETTLLNYPHILLGAGEGLINYGAVDFEALELEPKRGAVGLILDINEVEVTPSREAVVWSAKTRAAVVKSYNEIVDTATKLINQELNNATDYWDWIQKAGSIKSALVTNKSATGSVLQKLSGIIDASTINKIYYRKEGMNKLYTSSVKDIMGDKLLVRIFGYDNWGRKVKRDKIKSVNSVSGYNTYVTEGASNKYKDRYIYEQIENKEYVVVKRLEFWQSEKTSNLIGNSNKLLSYDNVVVPEDFMDLYLKEEVDGSSFDDDESISVTVDPTRLAKLRKLEQKVLFHKAYANSNAITYTSNEVKISNILRDYSKETVIYGSFANRSLINEVVGLFPHKIFSIINYYDVPYHVQDTDLLDTYEKTLASKEVSEVNAMLISKENVKYLSDKENFQHISEFLVESYKDNKLVFNKTLRFALTFHLISKILDKHNINSLNKDFYDLDTVNKFYTSEFLNLRLFAEFFKSAVSDFISPFFNAAILYEMGKDNLDSSTSQDYLDAVDKHLPEELCEMIDEIEDLHIIDVDLVNKAEEYCQFYAKYNPILKTIRYASDVDIIDTLYPLVQNYERFPEESKYFQ